MALYFGPSVKVYSEDAAARRGVPLVNRSPAVHQPAGVGRVRRVWPVDVAVPTVTPFQVPKATTATEADHRTEPRHVMGRSGRAGCETLPNSCQTHAPTGGSPKHIETHGSRSQMLAKEKDRLDMAALVNLRQLGANSLRFGC